MQYLEASNLAMKAYSMTAIKDQTICTRGKVILTIILMNGKGTEFDIFHVHIAQDVVYCVRPPLHIGSPWSNANVYLWPPTEHQVKGLNQLDQDT
jgi:hypothetical protein